jgi:hypothetical protein
LAKSVKLDAPFTIKDGEGVLEDIKRRYGNPVDENIKK